MFRRSENGHSAVYVSSYYIAIYKRLVLSQFNCNHYGLTQINVSKVPEAIFALNSNWATNVGAKLNWECQKCNRRCVLKLFSKTQDHVNDNTCNLNKNKYQ